MWFNSLLDVKLIHLVDRTDLFKISDLVLGGKEIVKALYSELPGWPIFTVRINGLENFL